MSTNTAAPATHTTALSARLDQVLVADAVRARDAAGEERDAESQDLMIGRITFHQKTIWMLKSFLRG
jgi:starvation-inducible DNA-binding protein